MKVEGVLNEINDYSLVARSYELTSIGLLILRKNKDKSNIISYNTFMRSQIYFEGKHVWLCIKRIIINVKKGNKYEQFSVLQSYGIYLW